MYEQSWESVFSNRIQLTKYDFIYLSYDVFAISEKRHATAPLVIGK